MTRAKAVCGALLLVSACGGDAEEHDANEAFSGGAATVFDVSRMAFARSLPSPAIARPRRLRWCWRTRASAIWFASNSS